MNDAGELVDSEVVTELFGNPQAPRWPTLADGVTPCACDRCVAAREQLMRHQAELDRSQR